MSLDGKVALVTGGAQGIGRAVVKLLLESSAKVAVVDLNEAGGEECKVQLDAEFGEGRCAFIQCDVSNGDALRETFQRTVDQFGRLDIVINNAGINNEKDWEKTIQVNLVRRHNNDLLLCKKKERKCFKIRNIHVITNTVWSSDGVSGGPLRGGVFLFFLY
ncbi:15-hydroxyprostaglandin dehydrogenase [NAD(+)]-like [Mugil cephalus]|uniref:15-hydroxyprostaglandin dehydrogenase [NAD(+)]-like n=1 Tax=Mugil cephalus TaxID=48193 RepID=UPI001FB69892|nr:15-hydroxyprostaglandin dehydrogenase [NAD(+)]-like [Mugil cephalus]